MNVDQIEYFVAQWLDVRRNLIVPHVSWGLGLHECDLLVLSRSGYATEIEIKVSMWDLRRDGKKKHGHRSTMIKRLYFAMPAAMRGHESEVPENAGIIYVGESGDCEIARYPLLNKEARRLSEAEQFHLARLGTMRIWSLKKALLRSKAGMARTSGGRGYHE